MEASIVQKSAFGVERVERLDAEFVRSGPLQLEVSILNDGGVRLDALVDLSKIETVGKQFAQPDAAMQYLDIDGVERVDGLAYTDTLIFSDLPSRAKYVLAKDDVLVSNVRPNRGIVTLATGRIAGSIASSGFTSLRLADDSPVSPELLFAFMRTHHARVQLVRRDRGSMYPAVLQRDVLDVAVPIVQHAFAAELESEVRDALTQQDEFFGKLIEASALLDEFLAPYGAPPSPLESDRATIDTTIIFKSDALGEGGAKRLDAEFFRSEYTSFHDHVKSLGPYFTLQDQFTLFTGRRSTGDEPVRTFKQGSLTNAGINWTAVGLEEGDAVGALIEEGDILLASTAHEIYYVGRKVDVVRAMPNDIASSNQAVAELIVIRTRADAGLWIPEEYVAAFLRHAAGLHQVQRCIRGLRGGHTYPSDLAQYVIVPEPTDKWLADFEKLSADAVRIRRLAAEAVASVVTKFEHHLNSRGHVAGGPQGD